MWLMVVTKIVLHRAMGDAHVLSGDDSVTPNPSENRRNPNGNGWIVWGELDKKMHKKHGRPKRVEKCE